MRKECKDCNHSPVCKVDLQNNEAGECPFYEPNEEIKVVVLKEKKDVVTLYKALLDGLGEKDE